ncbi:MAG: DUF924 domain-containing protein [Gammaproteobacteria bacterium]|nr:DUF924 domain-containing protein [Gammaproteobacteria bacterium]
MDEARGIRTFWFGALPLSAAGLEQRMRFWFGGGTAPARARRDEQIRQRFAPLLERAAAGELEAWADGPRRRLSLIVLLDQFPRNMFRGTARAFAYDAQALGLTLSGMQSGADAALDPVERIFFYMPLQHAELRDVQDESVAAYRRLLGEAPEELHGHFAAALRSAENHRALIERFGRFPHRNALLGRMSTEAEADWLRSGGASFGQ